MAMAPTMTGAEGAFAILFIFFGFLFLHMAHVNNRMRK
jgi:hypothetical protein